MKAGDFFELVAVLLGLALVLVLFWFDGDESRMLNECAKQNNVYKCKLVAVPVEGE